MSDAKMGGHAIYADGTKVDVKAVKSNRQPNTYIYAKVLGPYTKIVVVELANDPETGALKYQARSWYKEGDHTANIANQDISSATGYNPMGKGGYSLSDLHYSVNAVRSTSETVADIEEYTDQTLFKPANDSGESSGDVRFNGAGGGNVIKSNVTRGNVHFNGGGIANVICIAPNLVIPNLTVVVRRTSLSKVAKKGISPSAAQVWRTSWYTKANKARWMCTRAVR